MNPTSDTPSLWSCELQVPGRHGDRLPDWGVKYFKEYWFSYKRKHGVKYTGPMEFEIVGGKDGDIIWRASRPCKPDVKRDGGLRLAVPSVGGSGRRDRHLLAEIDDERARLDLLAGHGTLVVSPLREDHER